MEKLQKSVHIYPTQTSVYYMSTFESNIELSKFFKINFLYRFGKVSRNVSISNCLRFNLSKNVTQLAASKVQGSSHR